MNSYDVLSALDAIAAESSRNEKENILARVIEERMMKDVVKLAYDPFVTFGLTPPKVETTGIKSFDLNDSRVWATLYALANREITGNAAKDAVLKLMMSYNQASADLLWRILSKDLRCGITATTVNKLLPGTIPTFDVMLAHKFEPKRIKTWPVAVEPKLDGVRVVCLVREGQAKFFSRTGKPFPAVEHLGIDVVTTVINAMSATASCESEDDSEDFFSMLGGDSQHPTIALDGEIVSGSFNKTVGDVRRKDEEATDAEYHIFDALPFGEFTSDASEIKIGYKDRRRLVEFIVSNASSKAITHTPRYFAHSVEEIQEWYQKFRDRGLEGAIVKPFEAPYSKKRSFAWLKMKNEDSEDLRVIGAFEGTGKYAGNLGGLIVERPHTTEDGGVRITTLVEVRVGGGFSDEQRTLIWNAYNKDLFEEDKECHLVLGRLIEVEFHEVTPDGSLRHPRFIKWRDDKDERVAA